MKWEAKVKAFVVAMLGKVLPLHVAMITEEGEGNSWSNK